MLVEPATSADIDAVTEVHVEGGRVAYRGIYPDELLDGLDRYRVRHGFRTETTARVEAGSPDRLEVLLVSRVGEGVAGMVHTKTARAEDAPPGWAAITHIYVHARAWRQGYGTALMQAATRWLREGGAEGMLLWVVEGNYGAHRFYESLGWRVEPDRRRPLWAVPDVFEIQFRLQE